jgi:hypothetical protein
MDPTQMVHQCPGKPLTPGWRDEDALALCGPHVHFGSVGANQIVASPSSAARVASRVPATSAAGENSLAPAILGLAARARSSSRRTPCHTTI